MILPRPKTRRQFKHYFSIIKDGTITGAADDDPSGIITYTQAGAAAGYSMLWLLLLITPVLVAIEQMSSRIGITTKKGLARVIRDKFGLFWALVAVAVLVLSNILTVSADIAAMGEILSVWTGTSDVAWSLFFGFSILLLLLRGQYKSISFLLFLLTPLLLLYVFSGLMSNPDLLKVADGAFVPQIGESKLFITVTLALIGTTLSPYLLFWQTAEEVESKKTVSELETEDRGVAWGMIYSDLIAFFIIVAAGTVFFGKSIELEGAKQAALALRPLAGDAAFALYSLGIIFGGLVGVPVLIASAAYGLADVFNWPEGLDKKEWEARWFYLAILLVVACAMAMVSLDYNPITLVIFSQAVQGALMPILIFMQLKICNDQKLIGHHQNGWFINLFSWVGIVLTVGTLGALLFTLL